MAPALTPCLDIGIDWHVIFYHRKKLNPLRSARILAYLNMAIMDAGIACWDAKYFTTIPDLCKKWQALKPF